MRGCGVLSAAVLGVSDLLWKQWLPSLRGHCWNYDRDRERAERRARQRELAERLKASCPMDGMFEQIDAMEDPLEHRGGQLNVVVHHR